MPILDVEIVVEEGEPLPGAAAISDAAARVLGSAPGGTWVRLRALARGRYAENGGGPDAETRPVFVTVLEAKRPGPVRLAAEAAELTREIAAICGRPVENVHILYEPPAAGRIAFGGRLVETPQTPE